MTTTSPKMNGSAPVALEPATSRATLRKAMIRTIEQLQHELTDAHGFEPYRQSELLNPATRRHVRFGYASDEWTITTGRFPANGYGGVAQLRMLDVQQTRLDLRGYERGQRFPTMQELIALVLS